MEFKIIRNGDKNNGSITMEGNEDLSLKTKREWYSEIVYVMAIDFMCEHMTLETAINEIIRKARMIRGKEL